MFKTSYRMPFATPQLKSKTSVGLHGFSLFSSISSASPSHYVFYFSNSSMLSNYISEGYI